MTCGASLGPLSLPRAWSSAETPFSFVVLFYLAPFWVLLVPFFSLFIFYTVLWLTCQVFLAFMDMQM